MPSWGIGCFHLWLKDTLPETDTRSSLFRKEAERAAQRRSPKRRRLLGGSLAALPADRLP